jgi:hypothetical protein
VSARSRQAAAFNIYLAQHSGRSLKRLRDEISADPKRYGLTLCPSLRTLEAWSARYEWSIRIAEIEERARAAEEREHIDHVREHRQRLHQEGMLLQQKGINWLSAKEPEDVRAHEAIRAIVEGFRLEALALGEATERIAVEETDARVEKLSDDDLERLIQVARQSATGGPG